MMETIRFDLVAPTPASGTRPSAIVGVVGSGNLEILVERGGAAGVCTVEVSTAATGFAALWADVLADFVARRAAGGLRLAINDGGARPDTVSLRLAQAVRLIEPEEA